MMDEEMMKALQADAEKLRALGADVADPVFLTDEPSLREPVSDDVLGRVRAFRDRFAELEALTALLADHEPRRENAIAILEQLIEEAERQRAVAIKAHDDQPHWKDRALSKADSIISLFQSQGVAKR